MFHNLLSSNSSAHASWRCPGEDHRQEMQKALLGMLGQPVQQQPVKVDLAEKLAEKGLARFYDPKVRC